MKLLASLAVLGTLLWCGLIAIVFLVVVLGISDLGPTSASQNAQQAALVGQGDTIVSQNDLLAYQHPSGQGDNTITLRARAMATHLHACQGCLGDAAYDAGFPQAVIIYGEQTCPFCSEWANGNFQCVSFVLAAYGAPLAERGDTMTHPLELWGDGDTFWSQYGTAQASHLGYTEIATGSGLPASVGDIMTWQGGAHGHVSIVLDWNAPQGSTPGSITFAQANGEMPIQTLPIRPDLTINTNDGYWNGFTVSGYIHPRWLPITW